ncbi:hypothetical protein SNEBB_007662 [Seison nebaliae]|nr:hypothetical protein SNEBB_007662 [Seison nebaliae]
MQFSQPTANVGTFTLMKTTPAPGQGRMLISPENFSCENSTWSECSATYKQCSLELGFSTFQGPEICLAENESNVRLCVGKISCGASNGLKFDETRYGTKFCATKGLQFNNCVNIDQNVTCQTQYCSADKDLSVVRNCMSGCVCPTGLVLSGGQCIPKDQCTCIWNGDILLPSQQKTNCLKNQKCKCINGCLKCQYFSCELDNNDNMKNSQSRLFYSPEIGDNGTCSLTSTMLKPLWSEDGLCRTKNAIPQYVCEGSCDKQMVTTVFLSKNGRNEEINETKSKFQSCSCCVPDGYRQERVEVLCSDGDSLKYQTLNIPTKCSCKSCGS